jgi:hypothetical protein
MWLILCQMFKMLHLHVLGDFTAMYRFRPWLRVLVWCRSLLLFVFVCNPLCRAPSSTVSLFHQTLCNPRNLHLSCSFGRRTYWDLVPHCVSLGLPDD